MGFEGERGCQVGMERQEILKWMPVIFGQKTHDKKGLVGGQWTNGGVNKPGGGQRRGMVKS